MFRLLSLLAPSLALCLTAFAWPSAPSPPRYRYGHGTVAERRDQLRRLARSTTNGAHEQLLQALESPSGEIRAEACRLLPENTLPLARPLLHHLLDDPDAQVRAAALAALGRSPSGIDQAPLHDAFSDPAPEVRKAAVTVGIQALQRRAPPPNGTQTPASTGPQHALAQDLLAQRTASPTVALTAFQGLAGLPHLPDPAQERTLLAWATSWLHNQDATTVALATEVLIQRGTQAGLEALGRLATSPRATLSSRQQACRALGQLGQRHRQHAAQAEQWLAKALAAASPTTDGAIPASALLALAHLPHDTGLARLTAQDGLTLPLARLATRALLHRPTAQPERRTALLVTALEQTTKPLHVLNLVETLLDLAAQESLAAERSRLQTLRLPAIPETTRWVLLASAGDPSARTALLHQLTSPTFAAALSPRRLQHLAVALRSEPLPATVASSLVAALTQQPPEARSPLWNLLAATEGTLAQQTLLQAALTSGPAALSESARGQALLALAHRGDPATTGPVLHALPDLPPGLHVPAARMLGATANPATCAALLRLAATPHHSYPLRRAALLASGQALARLQADGALHKKDAQRFVAVLEELMNAAYTPLATAAMATFGAWGPPTFAQPLAVHLRSPDPERRRSATDALGHLVTDTVRPVLRHLLREADPALLQATVLALAERGDARDLVALQQVAARHPFPIPATVAFAIQRWLQRQVIPKGVASRALCDLARSTRDPLVKANGVAGLTLATLDACPEVLPLATGAEGPALAPPTAQPAAVATRLLLLTDTHKQPQTLRLLATRFASGAVRIQASDAAGLVLLPQGLGPVQAWFDPTLASGPNLGPNLGPN